MAAALALGAGTGLGLWVVVVWLVPPRRSLSAKLADLFDPVLVPADPVVAADGVGWTARLGRPFVPSLHALGLPGARVARDLAVLGRVVPVHLAEKAVLALLGLLAPVLGQVLLVVAGTPLGFEVPVIAGVVLAAVGFVEPDLRVRRDAALRRSDFRHALSAFLDLVWITLAGGAGVDSALNDGVDVGRGWAFGQLRRALESARLTRRTPWAALRQLGDELDVAELVELSGSVSLAGTEGAKVRVSLGARATSLRTHQLAAAETEAEAATERMSLPIMLLFLGFLIFIAYPALSQVLDAL